MIVCKSENFAFFRAPKTGSTTTTFLLRIGRVWPDDAIMSYTPYGEFDPQNFVHPVTFFRSAEGDPLVASDVPPDFPYPYFAHTTAQQLVDKERLTMDEIRNMRAYSFIRHPYERVLSAAVHVVGRHANPKTVKNMLTRVLQAVHPKQRRSLGMVAIPMADYLYVNGEIVVKPLLNSPFKDAVNFICDEGRVPRFANIPRLNARPAWKSVYAADDFWTDEIQEGFREIFAEDFRIYETLVAGKELKADPNYVVSDPKIHTQGVGPRGFAHARELQLEKEAVEAEIRRKETPDRRAV
jgi:hypothetical protein